MKRIIIAIVFIVICLITAVVELGYVGTNSNKYISQIEEIDKMMKKDEFEEAIKLCRQTENDWSKTEEKMDILLIHDYVDDVSISLTQMRSHIENGNPDMYFAESDYAKKILASIKGSEYPNFENIL